MMNGSDVDAKQDLELSALVDGELEPSEVAPVCELWRRQSSTRQRWHEYQLIGDVLRSEDLASTSTHDEDFLAALRSRLATEPVVLAPPRLPDADADAAPAFVPKPASRRRMATFGAVAAGFMVVVAGALTITGAPSLSDPAGGPASKTLAQATSPTVVSAIDPQSDPLNELEPIAASGKLVRDARLDRYFSAHQQWSAGSLMGGHAAFLRQSSGDGTSR